MSSTEKITETVCHEKVVYDVSNPHHVNADFGLPWNRSKILQVRTLNLMQILCFPCTSIPYIFSTITSFLYKMSYCNIFLDFIVLVGIWSKISKMGFGVGHDRSTEQDERLCLKMRWTPFIPCAALLCATLSLICVSVRAYSNTCTNYSLIVSSTSFPTYFHHCSRSWCYGRYYHFTC